MGYSHCHTGGFQDVESALREQGVAAATFVHLERTRVQQRARKPLCSIETRRIDASGSTTALYPEQHTFSEAGTAKRGQCRAIDRDDVALFGDDDDLDSGEINLTFLNAHRNVLYLVSLSAPRP